MPRGKKNPDPKNVSDIDLLSLRPHFEAFVEGHSSPVSDLTLMQMGRLMEGIVAQYRSIVPPKKAPALDAYVARTMDQILIAEGASRGALETIHLLASAGKLSPDDEAKARYAEALVASRYRLVAAAQVLELMRWVLKMAANRSVGRPAGSRPFCELDWKILKEVARRAEDASMSIDEMVHEVRAVVQVAAAEGLLDDMRRGGTFKENIDTHTRRLQGRLRELFGTSGN